jgi:radical SAM protein with 4Fe4S-binding SPASM domain
MTRNRLERIYVEITNICNLRCDFCPGTSRAPASMQPAFFRRVLGHVAPLTRQVCLHVLGEPLLHPHFPEIMDLCAEAGLEVNLTTNGMLLGRRAQTLIKAGALRQVNFSLQALRTTGGIDMDALNGILDFTLTVSRIRPELYVNLRLWTLDNLRDAPAGSFNTLVLERIAERLGIARPAPSRGRKSLRLLGRVYLHADTAFSWPGDMTAEESKRGFCHALSTHCAILADGTVCPCCLDADGRLALGSLHEAGLEEILDSPRAKAMREGFDRGWLVEEICRRCTYCRRFKSRAQKAFRAPETEPEAPDENSWTTIPARHEPPTPA